MFAVGVTRGILGPIDSNGRHAFRTTALLLVSPIYPPLMGQRRASMELPVELLEHIFDQPELTFCDVLRCKRVCVRICLRPPRRGHLT
jgi:hypothetical protein